MAFIAADTLVAMGLQSFAETHFLPWPIVRGLAWPALFMYGYRRSGEALSELGTWAGMLCAVGVGVLVSLRGAVTDGLWGYVAQAVQMLFFSAPMATWGMVSVFLVINALRKRYLRPLHR